jgi:hypothetical protein
VTSKEIRTMTQQHVTWVCILLAAFAAVIIIALVT